jgi:hypothetical protein
MKHEPCVACFEFDCAAHYCRGHERPEQPDSQPCPLFLERGSSAARLAGRNRTEVLADLRRRYPEATISRASAPTAAPT